MSHCMTSKVFFHVAHPRLLLIHDEKGCFLVNVIFSPFVENNLESLR